MREMLAGHDDFHYEGAQSVLRVGPQPHTAAGHTLPDRPLIVGRE